MGSDEDPIIFDDDINLACMVHDQCYSFFDLKQKYCDDFQLINAETMCIYGSPFFAEHVAGQNDGPRLKNAKERIELCKKVAPKQHFSVAKFGSDAYEEAQDKTRNNNELMGK